MKHFVIEQKITLMANQYSIFAADEAGAKQHLVAFVHQKRLAFREQFSFYADTSMQQVLFTVKARSVVDLGAKYDVTDENGAALGVVGKVFGASLLRSTWNVFAPGKEDQPLVVTKERSTLLAIARRIWELLPYIGDLPFFVKYHFDFTRPQDDKILATYNKTTTFRDHYLLSVEDELVSAIDWRALVAVGVLLDALQSR